MTHKLSNKPPSEATQPRFDQHTGARGFSLVELLVVIAVLSILIALTMTLAGGVTRSAKSRTAADTIRVLDQSVEAWTAATGDKLPKMYRGLPIVDGRLTGADGLTASDVADWPQPLPSLSLYTASMADEDSVVGVIGSLDPAIRRSELVELPDAFEFEAQRVFDPWGNQIRFVHPAYDGGWGEYLDGGMAAARPELVVDTPELALITPITRMRFSRSWRITPGDPGDADEGICPGGGTRAYFYSAGPDGDPGTIEDNVYSERPQFPAETADIRN